MIRVLLFFVLVAAAAAGLSWIADRPGSLELNWLGYQVEMSVMAATISLVLIVLAIMALWSLLGKLFDTPGTIANAYRTRRQERGLAALGRGLIAVGSGDAAMARKFANQANRALSDQPMALMLKAQAAQLSGDRVTARRIYEQMLEDDETELIGLRGLYLEARRENEPEAARQFAQRAVRKNPKLSWSAHALLEIQSRAGEWAEARETLKLTAHNSKLDRKTAVRQRAVLLTAEAVEIAEQQSDKALKLALEAHRLAPDLVPAATVAGRILASQGSTAKSAKVLARTWSASPHPDLALAYAHARPGDAIKDRLKRVKSLAARTPHNMEGPIAVAEVAIDGQDWGEARKALKPLLSQRPSARVCTLMARIEGGEFGDKGRVREWLARAVRAPRDPAWTADGYVSDEWMPVSPITGKLDAFEWKLPVEQLGHRVEEELSFEEFIPLKAPESVMVDQALGAEQVVALAGVTTIAGAAAAGPQQDFSAIDKGPVEENSAVNEDDREKDRDDKGDALPEEAVQTSREVIEGEVLADSEPTGQGSGDKTDVSAGEAETVQKDEDAKIAAMSASKPRKDQVLTDKKTTSQAPRPHIFVPPRAPDDPGPEPVDPDDRQRLPYRYRYSQ